MPQKKNVETKLNVQDHKTTAREQCSKFPPQQQLTCGENGKVRYPLFLFLNILLLSIYNIIEEVHSYLARNHD